MKTFGNEWKRRIRSGEFLHGGHIFLPNSGMAEAMACFGYEFLWIDAEHGTFDREQILTHVTAINGAGAGAFVRVNCGDPAVIKSVLEMGPDGIIIPQVNSAKEAADVIAACCYPPRGIRGFGPRRANRYATIPDSEYIASIDESLVKIIQIEHINGVKEIDAILKIPNLDSVVIGAYDLSGSMGLLSQLQHPDVLAACEKAVTACKKAGMPVGPSIGPFDDVYIKWWLSMGVNFMFCGDDISFIQAGTKETLAKVKKFSSG
jgi:2-dehydro-3-deoxyglucarate aldolase/4-hydroxy-2-oxoheptanedioate aldolase